MRTIIDRFGSKVNLQTPASVKLANLLINRMREHTDSQPRAKRAMPSISTKKSSERAWLALIGLMDRELPQQRSWHRVRFVALIGLGKETRARSERHSTSRNPLSISC